MPRQYMKVFEAAAQLLVRFPNPFASDIHGSWGAWLLFDPLTDPQGQLIGNAIPSKTFPNTPPSTFSLEYLLMEEQYKNVHPQWWLVHNHKFWSPLHDSSERSDCSALQCIVAVSQSAYLHHLQLHSVWKVKLWGVIISSKVIWAGGLFFPTGSQLWTLT